MALEFLKSCLSEATNVGSYSRISGMSVVFAAIVWISYIVFRTHVLPDFTGVTLFITGGNAQYALNQARAAFGKNETPPTQ